jgi:hypothetical protein
MPAIDRRLRGRALRGTEDANPAILFTIEFARNSHVGSAEINLLEAIHKAGSLSQAARDLRISYKHAWLLIDSDRPDRGSEFVLRMPAPDQVPRVEPPLVASGTGLAGVRVLVIDDNRDGADSRSRGV